MDTVDRANIILALAEVVQDVEVINRIEQNAGKFTSIEELCELEKQIMNKVIMYRVHDLWPPKIAPITDVMKFN